MDRLGIDHLSVFGLPPVDYINLVADLGCSHCTVALSPIIPFNPHGYPVFSLKADKQLRADTLAAMADRGVVISGGSGFLLGPETDVAAYAEDFEVYVELGVKRVNAVSFDTDRSRGFDNFARVAELGGKYGVETMVEIVPTLLVDDLETGLAVAHHVGRADFRLLIDTMHVTRAGNTAAQLAELDPSLVGYIQLCDAPMKPTRPDYGEEVTFYRLAPGDGELPLAELMAALPRDVLVGLEIPMRDKAEVGVGPYDRLKPCVDGARRLLAEVDARA